MYHNIDASKAEALSDIRILPYLRSNAKKAKNQSIKGKIKKDTMRNRVNDDNKNVSNPQLFAINSSPAVSRIAKSSAGKDVYVGFNPSHLHLDGNKSSEKEILGLYQRSEKRLAVNGESHAPALASLLFYPEDGEEEGDAVYESSRKHTLLPSLKSDDAASHGAMSESQPPDDETPYKSNSMDDETKHKLRYSKDPAMDELRNYFNRMDKYSLHNFIIYDGKVLVDTPEFQSFKRQYRHQWGAISFLVDRIQSLMSDYQMKMVIVNGPKLYSLACLNLAAPDKDSIFECLTNMDKDKSSIVQMAGVSGTNKNDHSNSRPIVLIQSYMRRKLVYLITHRIRKEKTAVLRIQTRARQYLYKKRSRLLIKANKMQLQSSWKLNQAKLREWWDGNLKIQQSENTGRDDKRRLIVHIPTISVPEQIRMLMDNLPAIQNAHISCLYQLLDPDVSIVYVLPAPLNDSEISYFDRFLAVLGISTLPKRLHFVFPELTNFLPQHLSVANILWCSRRALDTVRKHVRRFRHAMIISSGPSWADKRIARLLDVPLLGPDPSICDKIQSRSFCKKLFAEGTVSIPVGAHDVYSGDEVVLALARLIASNLDVNRWMVRLNHDFNNESVVTIDVKNISIVQSLRAELELIIANHKEKAMDLFYSKSVQLSARKKLIFYLRSNMKKHILIGRDDYFPSWDHYILSIHRFGAVIEAEPPDTLGYVEGLSFIDPLGEVHDCGGVEVLLDKSMQSQVYRWPQSLVPQQGIDGATRAVAEILYTKWKVVGHFSIRFTVYWDPLENISRLWATDLKFGMSPLFGNLGTVARVCNPKMKLPLSLIPQLPEGRHCIYLPTAFHSSLKTVRPDVFFKFCRMHGVGFDANSLTGTLFYLTDSLVSGCISAVCIGSSRAQATRLLEQLLHFVEREYGGDVSWERMIWSSVASLISRLKVEAKASKNNEHGFYLTA